MHKENAIDVLITPNSRYVIVCDEGIKIIDFQHRSIVKAFEDIHAPRKETHKQ